MTALTASTPSNTHNLLTELETAVLSLSTCPVSSQFSEHKHIERNILIKLVTAD